VIHLIIGYMIIIIYLFYFRATNQITTDSMESISICTALLLPSAPHLITPALQFFENSRSRSLFSRLETCSDARSVPGASALRIARAALLLLRNEQARATLTRVWNWSPVFLLLQVWLE
jgi:hypothetical protein